MIMQPNENESQPSEKEYVPMAPTVYISFPDKSGVIIASREKRDLAGNWSLGECNINIQSPVSGMYGRRKGPYQAESWARENWELLEKLRKTIEPWRII